MHCPLVYTTHISVDLAFYAKVSNVGIGNHRPNSYQTSYVRRRSWRKENSPKLYEFSPNKVYFFW